MSETENKLELLATLVTVNVRHEFDNTERLQKSSQIAQLISDIEHEEAEKKAIGAEYKNKIDKLKAEAKLISGHITNGYAYIDKPAALYLDFSTNERVYLDKQDETELKRETFHTSDYQKKLVFEGTQEQIDENNDLFNYAEGESGSQGLKPVPKDNLGEHYGKNFLTDEDISVRQGDAEYPTDDNGLYRDRNGNPTDIHPRDLANELKDAPGSSELEKVIKQKVEAFKKSKRGK